jgi:Asp/Glu/hydantoin racemase
MADSPSPTEIGVLIINPNTSEHMTDALKPLVQNLGYNHVSAADGPRNPPQSETRRLTTFHDQVAYTFFTCPEPGIPSINSPDDAAASAEHCLPHLIPLLPHHDSFLVACYSQHPLVSILKSECDKLAAAATKKGYGAQKHVLGIFEASVTTSLTLLAGSGTGHMFGIVSTGKIWEEALKTAVEEFLNVKTHHRDGGGKFLGCETTGLSAVELHDLPSEEVRAKMVHATEKLARWGCQEEAYKRKLAVVCLGCAGMVGLEQAVREGCVNVMGDVEGRKVRIVDGVKAGVGMLIALVRGDF